MMNPSPTLSAPTPLTDPLLGTITLRKEIVLRSRTYVFTYTDKIANIFFWSSCIITFLLFGWKAALLTVGILSIGFLSYFIGRGIALDQSRSHTA